MMHWLLKYDGYPPGIVFTILLHGGLLLFMIERELEAQYVTVERPSYVVASVIKDNPQQVRRQADLLLQRQQQEQAAQQRARQQAAEQKRQADAAAEQKRQAAAAEQKRQADAAAEQKRQTAAATAAAEQKRKADAERQQVADAEKKRQAEAEKQRQAAAEAEQKRQAAAAEQQRQQAAAAAAAKAQADAAAAQTDLVSQYAALIHDLISQNWVIPPQARNGMTAVVEIRMTPIGDIVTHTITRSSGNPVFDRSVDQAVARVGSIPEMRELPSAVFERSFRVFQLVFSPEDLLR